MLTGCIIPIVTPMTPEGELDFATLKKLIDWYIENGVSGLVIAGTTGESATVDFHEHCSLIECAVTHVAGRVHVMAGTGGNSTSEAIELTEFAKTTGANSCLSVVPYYNKPTQEGMYRHFRAIAEKVDLPLYLYNVPGRTVADLTNDTVIRLMEIPNIVGLKDATGDIARASEMFRMLRLKKRDDFAMFSGDDITSLPFLLLGGHGVISVTACVAPRAIAELCRTARAGDIAAATAINDKLIPLHRKLFVEGNPVPVKWAMTMMNLIRPGIRLPLAPLSEANQPIVRQALVDAGCL